MINMFVEQNLDKWIECAALVTVVVAQAVCLVASVLYVVHVAKQCEEESDNNEI